MSIIGAIPVIAIISVVVVILIVARIELDLVAAALSVALIAWCVVLALLVLQEAIGGSRLVDWSTDPVTWWGELALAACSLLLGVAVAVFIVRASRAPSAGSAETPLWIGLGFVAGGALGIAVGWLGLRVPTTPGYDVLERDEPLFIIAGVIAAAFGALVVIASIVALALSPQVAPGGVDAQPARPSASWTDPDNPTWRVVRARLLQGAGPGDLVTVTVEADSVIVALVVVDGPGIRRLATYPAGVRLEHGDDGGYRLAYGSQELAVLAPVDVDPRALEADLDAAAG